MERKPVPYAFMPTKCGRIIPWEIGKPWKNFKIEDLPVRPGFHGRMYILSVWWCWYCFSIYCTFRLVDVETISFKLA